MAIGWGIVSTGGFPDRFMAPAISGAQDTELVAVYSRSQERADAFAAKHGAKAAYSSLDELLNDSRVDVAFIASPNHLHAEHTKAAARAGKQILVEKPMALDVEEAMDMVKTCRELGVKLGVGFHMRQHPGVQQARELVQDGSLGVVSLAQGMWGAGTRGVADPSPRTGLSEWWSQPELIGGASSMMGSGVHCIDTLRFLLGQEVVSVAAITDGQTEDRPLENLAAMCLRFDGGAIGMMCCGRLMPDSSNDAVLYGSDGKVVLTDTLRGPLQGSLEVVSNTVNTSLTYESDPLGLYRRQVESFNNCLSSDQEPLATGVDGLRVVQVTIAMIESAADGRTVEIDLLPV